METPKQFDLIISFAPQDELAALAFQEFCQLDGLRVYMAALNTTGRDSAEKVRYFQHEGSLALLILSKAYLNAPALDFQPLVERSMKQILPFAVTLILDGSELPTQAAHFKPLQWRFSYRDTVNQVIEELIGQGWKPKQAAESTGQPASPQGQSIKGSRNIQIGTQTAGRDINQKP